MLLDGTFFEPYEVLSTSIPRGGRALPIAWHTYHRHLEGEDELSRNLIEEAFVTDGLVVPNQVDPVKTSL